MLQYLIKALGLEKKEPVRPVRQYSIAKPKPLPNYLEFQAGDIVVSSESRVAWRVVDYRDYYDQRFWAEFENGINVAVKRDRTVTTVKANILRRVQRRNLQ